MDLYEYQGKQLFARYGIPVSEGRFATSPEEARQAAEELGGPVVVKAQVLTGGRGKAGGIKLAADPDEAEERAGAPVLRRWVRREGPVGRPLDALLARDFARFEDQLATLAERGFVLRGGGG